MAQAATPGGLGLPCSPKQALALYQRLFRCPAGLGQLQAALRQVQEGQASPSGLELPTVLLAMERSRRAQEQLLWDLELLTGAGLGLFWPPRAQFCALRDQAHGVWSQRNEPHARTGGDSEQLISRSSRFCSSPRTGDTLSQNHQSLEGGQAPDLGEAGNGADPRWESPGEPAEPTPGCLQELDPTTSGSFGEPENSEFKEEERGQAEPTTQRHLSLSSGSLQRRKVIQEALGPSGLPPQGLPEPQDPFLGLGWSLGQDRAELQKLLGIKIPQSQRDEDPRGQGGEAPQRENEESPQSQREKTNPGLSREATQALGEVSGVPGWETPLVENKDAFPDQKENRPECLRKETPQGGEVNILQSSGGPGWISQAWEVAQGEAPTQPQEEGSSRGVAGDLCRSLGEQRPPPGGTESPGPQGRSTQQIQDKARIQRGEAALAVGEQGTGREGELAPLGPLARPHLTGPGAGMLAVPGTGGSEPREHPTALPGHPGLQDPGGGRCPAEQQVGERGLQPGGSVRFPGSLEERRGAAGAPKAAWPGSPGRAEAPAVVSAAQQEAALQRLLELHCAARDRRRQDREQQRLRVLEGLRIARNRHCRVHPLGPPPSPAQLLPQEDAEGQRRALREQLEQVHRERTGRLRALGARNTQNFQQLLCPPGAEEAAPWGSAHRS